jgi:hypothetical protein
MNGVRFESVHISDVNDIFPSESYHNVRRAKNNIINIPSFHRIVCLNVHPIPVRFDYEQLFGGVYPHCEALHEASKKLHGVVGFQ